MAQRTKKVRSTGRFGTRYGKTVRERALEVESKQKKKQQCPFCKYMHVKRMAKGIWFCPRCKKRFASGAYSLN